MANRLMDDGQAEFLVANCIGRSNEELADLMNSKFGLELTSEQINGWKVNHCITSQDVSKYKKYSAFKTYSDEMKEFIKQNYKGITTTELTDLFNDEFGTDFKPSQIRAFKQRFKLNSGICSKFKKGQKSWNKGTKGLTHANKTSFRKGHQPSNTEPIGTVKKKCGGYYYVKIDNIPNAVWHKNWKPLHHIVWECWYGPIPDGQTIRFIDGDQSNMDINNLAIVSRAEAATIVRNKLTFNNPGLSASGIQLAKLITKQKELEKNNEIK